MPTRVTGIHPPHLRRILIEPHIAKIVKDITLSFVLFDEQRDLKGVFASTADWRLLP